MLSLNVTEADLLPPSTVMSMSNGIKTRFSEAHQTLATARQILDLWDNEDYDPPEAEIWARYLEEHDPLSAIHVRYVGACQTPSTPISRAEDDRVHRQSGFLASFFRDLERVTQPDSDTFQVYGLPRAYLYGNSTIHDRDVREQILIAFFGYASLVNRASGGHHPQYQIGHADSALYRRFNSRSLHRLHELEDNFMEYPEFLNVIAEQSQPREVHGHTIIALIGKDVTLFTDSSKQLWR